MVSAGSEKQQISPKTILSPGVQGCFPIPAEPPDANKAFQSTAAMKASSGPGLKFVPMRAASPDAPLTMTAQVVPCFKQGWGTSPGRGKARQCRYAAASQRRQQGHRRLFLNPSLKKEPGIRKETKKLLPAIYQLAQIQQLTLLRGFLQD